MIEISIKIPDEFNEEILFIIAERIASKSQLSDEDEFKFSEEVKDRVFNLHE